MGYGLKVFSSGGTLQLNSDDDNRVLYQLTSSGTTGTISGATSDAWGSVTVSATIASETLLFIRPTATFAGQKAIAVLGSSSFTIYGPSNGVAYNYRLYRPTSLAAPTDSNWGLKIFKADGTTQVFNNNAAAVRIKATLSGTSASGTTGTLWGMPQYYIQRITAGLTAATSGTYYYALTFNSDGSISQSSERAFRGAVVSDPEDIITTRYVSTDQPLSLILTT